MLDGSKVVLLSGVKNIKPTAHSSDAAAQGAVLPPGQKVVLQSVPGMSESNFVCQYNGQTIQLMPIRPEPLSQSHSSSGTEGQYAFVLITFRITFLEISK